MFSINNRIIYIDTHKKYSYKKTNEYIYIGLGLNKINTNTIYGEKCVEKNVKKITDLILSDESILSFNESKNNNIKKPPFEFNNGLIYSMDYVKLNIMPNTRYACEEIEFKIYNRVLDKNTLDSTYEYGHIQHNSVELLEEEVSAREVFMYINNEKIICRFCDEDFIKDFLIPKIKDTNIIDINENVKSELLHKKESCIYKEIKCIQFSNKKNEESYHTDNYDVINVNNKTDEDIIKEIMDFKKIKQRYYIKKGYTLSDKNRQEVLLVDGEDSCLISIINGHWYINNKNIISYRKSNINNPMIKDNLCLNVDRIIEGFNSEPKKVDPSSSVYNLRCRKECFFKNKYSYTIIANWLKTKKKL